MHPDDARPDRRQAVRAADADRVATVVRLQQAVAEGRLDLAEFDERARSAYAAVTVAELDALVADLPPDGLPSRIVGTRAPEEVASVFGDIAWAGASSPPQRAGTVFGDIRIDLRGSACPADRVDLHLGTVFGDIDVVVAEGVDAELQGWTVPVSRKVRLAPVPRLAGTPLVVVHGRTVFGDLRLRSLAPGEPVSRWRALVDRLAPPPPVPPPLPPLPPVQPSWSDRSKRTAE